MLEVCFIELSSVILGFLPGTVALQGCFPLRGRVGPACTLSSVNVVPANSVMVEQLFIE